MLAVGREHPPTSDQEGDGVIDDHAGHASNSKAPVNHGGAFVDRREHGAHHGGDRYGETSGSPTQDQPARVAQPGPGEVVASGRRWG